VAPTATIRDEPGWPEKQVQLERILAGKPFRRALKPAQFLRDLVKRDFEGTPPDEYTLGVELFERRNNWIPMDDAIVRENLRRLRNLLETYYASDGVEDRLNLELSGYKPVFSYNIRHPFERQYRRALRHIGSDPKKAFGLLNSALGIEPGNARALAAWAEAELWRPLYGYDIDLPAIIAAAEGNARKSLQSDERCWRAHVVMGALYCCHMEWRKAAEAFGSALDSSPGETRAHPWYAAFLMATGESEGALALMKAKTNEPSDAPWPRLAYAVFLYAAREFEEARRVILETIKEHDENWLAHVMWSCVRLSLGTHRANVPGFGMSSPPRIAEGALVYPALSILCDIEELDPDYADYLLVKDMMDEIARKKLTGWEPHADADRRPYIGNFCLSPCQLAIGYMAVGDVHRAIGLLRQDLNRCHPLMAWSHLWPILDPLREYPEFTQLVIDMNLPSRL
jgi:hypothetical protein